MSVCLLGGWLGQSLFGLVIYKHSSINVHVPVPLLSSNLQHNTLVGCDNNIHPISTSRVSNTQEYSDKVQPQLSELALC